MQRWIVAAVVFMVLLVGGAGFAYWKYREHRLDQPTKIWHPIPTKPERTAEERKEVAEILKEKLGDLTLLARVSKDTGYAKDMGFASDEEAAKDLQRRLFAEVGTADTPNGKVPSINVGFNCKVREYKRMTKVTTRLTPDIRLVLGLPAPQKDPLLPAP